MTSIYQCAFLPIFNNFILAKLLAKLVVLTLNARNEQKSNNEVEEQK